MSHLLVYASFCFTDSGVCSIRDWEYFYSFWIGVWRCGGLLVSALASRLSVLGLIPGQQGHVLCSWARHFTITVPLSTLVYKQVTAKGNPVMD